MSSGPDDITRLASDDLAVPNQRIGAYRVVRALGEGGMGTVYLAVRDDDAFRKRVALKVLKRGTDTDAVVRRFRTERQILAGLDHPNIARLLDGGSTDQGLPYLVMEYVEGTPLDEYADAHGLDTTSRIRLFLQLCAAVQYAHQNLVIHRDIKPANVLVTADGVPKLLDFGIAKLLNADMVGQTMAMPTGPGLQLLTPDYASPEQVRGEQVTTATDVYSLGISLYELLTGRRPYRVTSRAIPEVIKVVCESEPERPSVAVTRAVSAGEPPITTKRDTRATTQHRDPQRLRRRLEGDLDNIVLKAISKEPSRRYASVDQFAEDLRRHLAGLPVLARQDTVRYRVAKFVRRHRVPVAAAAAILVALVLGVIGTAWQARAARIERERAEQRFNDVRQLANTFLFDVHDAVRDLSGSTPARQLMVKIGVDYLDKLAADAADRDDLRRELAAGYVRVGDVQGRPFNPNLGDSDGALESYRKAVALYQSLNVTPESPLALRRESATAHLRLSEVLSATGDTQGAMEAVRTALDLVRDVATNPDAPTDARRELLMSYSRMGDMLAATGATADALEHHRRALEIIEGLSATAPDDPANLRQLGTAYHKVGNVLGNPNYPNIGDHEAALVQMQKSVAVFERATARYPDNALFKRNLAVARSNVSDILVALGRREEAWVQEQRALETYEAQVREDPTNAAAKNDLAIAHYKTAEMLDAEGRTKEALLALDRAAAIQDQLSAADPTNMRAKQEVATNLSMRGKLQAKLGNRASLVSHASAIELCREITRRNPANVEQRVYLALALIERGDSARLLAGSRNASPEDMQLAERSYDEAVEIMSALEESKQISGTDLETLAKARETLRQLRERQ